MKISVLTLLLLASAFARADGDPASGERLYYDFGCYSCHGFNATGRVPLNGDASGIMQNEEVYLVYLRARADQNPINPKNTMPNYSAETLTDQQAKDIYAYIRSIEDDPPEVADIPAFVTILEDARQRSEKAADDQ